LEGVRSGGHRGAKCKEQGKGFQKKETWEDVRLWGYEHTHINKQKKTRKKTLETIRRKRKKKKIQGEHFSRGKR